ncbi:MAG TPA: hypothetical protein VMB72_00155 [Acidimicrobiales bacterium]|nr:hypothetical protein [Acidimicrobiales bacterium]
MTTSPDPLGKRALFWAPAERDEDGPRVAAERDVPGKHALFSDEARAGVGSVGAASRPAPAVRRGGPRRVARPAAGPGAAGARAPVPGPPLPGGRAPGLGRPLVGPIAVDCSTCGARSEIKVAEFVVLHLPVWLWRPGRGYTRFMTCPACRRRTWVSASWAAWTR